MTQFNASIVLNAEKATSQAIAFGSAITKTSKTLQKFQELTRKTTQGGGSNVFRVYENSISKLDVKMRNAVSGLHSMKKGMTDAEREFGRLTSKSKTLTKAETKRAESLAKTIDLQKRALPLMVSLNKKYDENARAVSKLKKVRNELNLVVASGLKTKAQAVLIFKKEAQAIRESTTAFKQARSERQKAELIAKKELATIERLTIKYDKQYAKKKKLAQVEKELNFLVKKGAITQEKMTQVLNKQSIALNKVDKNAKKVSSAHQRLQRAATAVSIATRLMLAGYIAMSTLKAYINIAKTADAIKLLDQKLQFFTGDSGAMNKMFNLTQKVGIGFKEAGRIITRFAVVTKGAFSLDTMTEWTATLTKSARATGTSTQEMTGALIQITQAMSAGRLMGDEYRSVTENLPLLTVALRDMFKGTSISLKEMSSRGLLTTDVLIEAFERLKDIVSDIPGTTDTVEARLAALGASWDFLASKIMDTKFVKSALDFISESFTALGNQFDDPNSGGNRYGRLLEDLNEAKEAAKEAKDAIDELINGGASGRGSVHLSSTRLKRGESNQLAKLRLNLKEKTDEVNRLQKSVGGFGDKKDETGLEAAKKAEREKEQREVLIRQSAKYGGFNKQAILDLANVEKQTLQISNDGLRKRKELSQTDAEMKRFFAEIDKKANEKIAKGERKYVNERLVAQGIKTKTNFDFIKNEELTKNSIVSIHKKFNKQIEDIAAARKRFDVEQSAGIKSTVDKDSTRNLSLSKKKGLEYTAIAENIKKQALDKEMDKVNIALAKLTTNDVAKSLSPYEKHLSIIAKLETKRKINIEKFHKIRRDGAEIAGKFDQAEADGLRDVNAVIDANIKLENERFSKKFAGQFSERIQAQTEYKDSLELLEAAKESGLLTTYEMTKAEDDLRIAFERSTNLANAKTGAMSQNDQLTEGMKDGLLEYAQTAKTTFEIVSEGMKGMVDSMSSKLADFIVTGKGSFKDMANAIIQDLIRIFIQAQITFAMKQMIGGMSGGGGGGLVEGLFGAALGGFGGAAGGTAVATSSLGGAGATAGFANPDLMFGGLRASGGPVSDDRHYIVGEKGPEIFVPNSSGKIIPNDQVGGGKRINIVNNITVSAPEGRLSRESMSQLQQKMAVGMDRSMRRNS